ncbi:MAG: sel1 repeat family protein [Bacteroidia bacterium]|nr:sel1 repeat family protein [Bacteroidia bacterium]MDW8235200.1 tetratricopeptide repeat protein [Bacteroidia bacterium]
MWRLLRLCKVIAITAAQNLSITIGVPGKDSRFTYRYLYDKPLDSLRKAALDGDTEAQMTLVEYYQIVQPKPDSARFFLHMAAKKGVAPAQYLLGLAYLRGVEALKKPIEGKRLLQAAAQQNYLLAIRVLYEVLEPPDSVSTLYVAVLPHDAREAFRYALQGAELRDPHAMMTVGRLYGKGKGTSQNDSLAQYWLEESAKTGYPAAQVLLAEWYQQKWQNPQRALYWAKQAADNPRSSLDEQYRARITAYDAETTLQVLQFMQELITIPAVHSSSK